MSILGSDLAKHPQDSLDDGRRIRAANRGEQVDAVGFGSERDVGHVRYAQRGRWRLAASSRLVRSAKPCMPIASNMSKAVRSWVRASIRRRARARWAAEPFLDHYVVHE
jgi:hypothetical protein